MRHSKFYFADADNDESRAPLPETAEERVDRFGFRTALFALALAFFVAAMWLINMPTFEKCSTFQNVNEPISCYEKLRDELSKPPAKGADIPKG
jgi:hypothetical protein